MKVIFFGASKFVIPLIKMLSNKFELVLVITTERNPLDAVPSFCQKNDIPFLSVGHISQATEAIHKTQATLGVLAYFGLLLPVEVLEAFPKGILNIHPSLLPKYRGATPVQSALLNGDSETGVTIIKLDREMDHGPMLAQEKETINPTDTTETLHDRLFTKGTTLLEELVTPYINDQITLTEQNHDQAVYTKHSLIKQDGFFEYTNPPKNLDQMIRAYYPWPTVWTRMEINGKEKLVKFLPNNKLHVEGKNPMSVKDFMNGYPELKKILSSLLPTRTN